MTDPVMVALITSGTTVLTSAITVIGVWMTRASVTQARAEVHEAMQEVKQEVKETKHLVNGGRTAMLKTSLVAAEKVAKLSPTAENKALLKVSQQDYEAQLVSMRTLEPETKLEYQNS